MSDVANVSILLARAKYRYQDQTKKDIKNTISNYRNLTPKIDKYVFPDGNAKDLLYLDGTIPVPYRGTTYNIPVRIWLTDQHPYAAPICYVNPTADMTIKVSKHVDQSGRIYLPYLSDWRANTSDLLGVIQVMICVFGDTPPLYAKPKITNSVVEPGAPGTGYPGYPPVRPPTTSGIQQPFSTQFPPANPYPGFGWSAPGNQAPGYPNASAASNPFNAPYPTYPSNPYQPPTATSIQSTSATTNSAQLSPNSGSGTITEEHIRASLLSAVEDKLKKRLKEKVAQCQAEIEVLKKTGEDLNKGKTQLEDLIRRMETDSVELNDCKQKLAAKNSQLDELVKKCEENGKSVVIDDAFGPTHPLYKQLLNAFSEENAIVDAIYYLSEALRKGIIDLDVFLKSVRELSRRQFFLRAIMRCCREKAKLPC